MPNSPEEPKALEPLFPLDRDTVMKQYQMMVDVHKFYFEIVLKFLIFHYAVTGAILSFYLSQPNVGIMRFALLFPVFMSLVFSAFTFFGSRRVDYLEAEIIRVTDMLGLKVYPDPKFLKYMLRVAGLLCLAIAIGLIVMSFAREPQPNKLFKLTARLRAFHQSSLRLN